MDPTSSQISKHIFAEHGGSGSGNKKIGKDGESKYINVPLGTVAKHAETGEVLFEITADKEEKILLEEVKEVKEMYISNRQPIKLLAMPNQGLTIKKIGLYWN